MLNILNYKNIQNLLLILYIFFLINFKSNNIGIDGYYFLAQWKYQRDVFEPHHLLHHWIYKVLGNFINEIIYAKVSEVEIIDYQGIYQIFNSFFWALSLIILKKLRELITGKKEYFTFWLVGFSGVGLRYATDVEVYIFPFFLSLLGTYKVFRFFQNHQLHDFILGSLLIHFAILNHQIQWVWWLVITYFLYQKYSKNLPLMGIYLLFSLSVPLIYWLVAMHKGLGFWEFCLHDYLHGSANLNFSWKSIFLTFINIYRTFLFFNEAFFQLNKNLLMNAVTFMMGFTFIISCVLFVKKIHNQFQFHEFQKIIFYLLMAYLLFALISHGNYEFMVCLPFFIVLLLPNISKISFNLKKVILISLFLWNGIFLLIPFHIADFYGKKELLNIYNENKESYFLLKESYWFRNFIYFHTGVENPQNILTKFDSVQINKLLSQGKVILTDYPNTENFNRRNFMQENSNLEKYFHLYRKLSYQTFYGEKILYEIRFKD